MNPNPPLNTRQGPLTIYRDKRRLAAAQIEAKRFVAALRESVQLQSDAALAMLKELGVATPWR